MKPWLFDILACPIDKHYPLELYIFDYETPVSDFQFILKEYSERTVNTVADQDVIKILHEGETIFIRDDIVVDKLSIKRYFDNILSSVSELNHIYDRSSYHVGKQSFSLIRNEIKNKITDIISKGDYSHFEQLIPELYFLNKIKVDIEIEKGIILCSKCHRWFPIIDTIPQMLPDEYRNEEEELKFLKTNKNLLDEKFFTQDLKPFNL